MAVVCDLQVIQNDVTQKIGDGAMIWEKIFNTGGRYPNGNAVLMFMVQGLTSTNSDVNIKINNKVVGVIENYKGANANHWFSQIVDIGEGILENGDNEIQIEAVSWSGASSNNLFDDFRIKDVICIFQQRA